MLSMETTLMFVHNTVLSIDIGYKPQFIYNENFYQI